MWWKSSASKENCLNACAGFFLYASFLFSVSFDLKDIALENFSKFNQFALSFFALMQLLYFVN
jgi:hypothetical protein